MSTRIKPQKFRGRELEEIREVDPEGKIVVHHRLVDTLGRMLKSGTIDQAMHGTTPGGICRRPSSCHSWTRSGRCRSCACPVLGASPT